MTGPASGVNSCIIAIKGIQGILKEKPKASLEEVIGAYKKVVERASKKRKKAAKGRAAIITPKRTTPSRNSRR